MRLPIVCTSVARHRLPEARALARAVAEHHDGQPLFVLVVDDDSDGATSSSTHWTRGTVRPGEQPRHDDEPFVRLAPGDLGLEPRSVHELALCREGDDLAACLVPALAAVLLTEERPVVALSPEVVLCGPLEELVEPAERSGVVLVPRLLGPVPTDGRDPSAAAIVAAGAHDPGILAVAWTARSFLDSWAASLRVGATSTVASIATCQPFLDLAPGSFGAHVLREPGYGVGYWNAHERELTWSEGHGYLASGNLLKLAHLEGFDPCVPELLAPGTGARPRVLLSEIPALYRLCKERVADLAAQGDGAAREPASRWVATVQLADGTRLDDRMRRLARRALAVVGASAEQVPDPFEPGEPFEPDGPPAFYRWLASPDAGDATAPTLPRYLGEIYAERRDLQWHFARVGTVDMSHFREWVASHGLDESAAPSPVRGALAATAWWAAPTGVVVAPPDALRPGVVLAGYLRAESGVGEAARLALDAIVAAGVGVVPLVIGLTPSRQQQRFGTGRDAGAVPVADREVNLLWTNAEQLPGFASIVGPELFAGRYNVGFWAWETERLPERLARHASMLDEIWVPSVFVRDAVGPLVDCPVVVFPHPIVAPAVDPGFEPACLGVPAGFRFLFTYDFLSSFARKNPLGVLEAYLAAFRPGEGSVLVLKSINGDMHPAERERLLLAASGRPDVVVLDGYLAPDARGALIASCDCFVSLHRAEGFGLGLAEAMALGKPVIATRYSGNLEFMDDTTALLVPATRTTVGPGAEPYEASSHWAEPDLAVAAAFMRHVAEDPPAAAALGRSARESVLSRHGAGPAQQFVTTRIGEIEKRLAEGYVSGASDAVRRML